MRAHAWERATEIPLLFAGFLGILLTPVSARLERYGIPRVVAALLTLTLAIAALVGIGFFFYTQLASFVEDVDLMRTRIEEMLDTRRPTYEAAHHTIDADRPVDAVVGRIVEVVSSRDSSS